MLFGMFAFGTLWFWLLCIISWAVLTVLVENTKPGFATITLLVTVFLLSKFGDVSLVSYGQAHPLSLLTWLGVYVLGGMVWAVAKWAFYVHSCRVKYNEKKNKWIEGRGYWAENKNITFPEDGSIPEKLKSDWLFYAKDRGIIPSASSEKERILTWMAFWIWSAAWTLINDPVRYVFRFLLNRFKFIFDSIVKHSFKDIGININDE